MNYYEERKEEIKTTKGRQLTIELSDADVRRLCEKAGQSGLTVAELLQNFIGDLVDGTYSNGSDERICAQQWFERCWFDAAPNNTFLVYLLTVSNIESVLLLWNSIQENKLELEQNKAKLQSKELTIQDIHSIQEDIDYVKDEIKNDVDELEGIFEDYKKSGGTNASFDDEIEKVLQWQIEMDQFATTQTNGATNGSAKHTEMVKKVVKAVK